MNKLVNLTPHNIVVFNEKTEEEVTIQPSGIVARVSTKNVPYDEVYGYGITIYRQEFGEIEGLPEPEDGTVYIVSTIVRQAAKEQGRQDVISPDTSPNGVIRNEKGEIVAVKHFVY